MNKKKKLSYQSTEILSLHMCKMWKFRIKPILVGYLLIKICNKVELGALFSQFLSIYI